MGYFGKSRPTGTHCLTSRVRTPFGDLEGQPFRGKLGHLQSGHGHKVAVQGPKGLLFQNPKNLLRSKGTLFFNRPYSLTSISIQITINININIAINININNTFNININIKVQRVPFFKKG